MAGDNEVETTAAARLASIEQHLPLVRHIVFQVAVHFPRHVDREELARAGTLGLSRRPSATTRPAASRSSASPPSASGALIYKKLNCFFYPPNYFLYSFYYFYFSIYFNLIFLKKYFYFFPKIS